MHSSHASDLDALLARRATTGASIAVVVPARDEEPTVGQVVGAIVDELAGDVGLVDEVVVVDGGSTDDTAAKAAAAGGRVVPQGTVLPDLGANGGKGDAMWQGLASTDADLVVFVDADVHGFDAGVVRRLLAPLLHDQDVLFSKAAYDRPFEDRPTGGGRVTELLARPLLSMFWPELSFLAQPLSGEYGGRTSLLRSLPFVQGYGVELGLLIDTVERHGPDAIAQVDLGVRHHEHQSLAALGRMAGELLAVGLERAERYGRRPVADPVLLQPVRGADGSLATDAHAVSVAERPPLHG